MDHTGDIDYISYVAIYNQCFFTNYHCRNNILCMKIRSEISKLKKNTLTTRILKELRDAT